MFTGKSEAMFLILVVLVACSFPALVTGTSTGEWVEKASMPTARHNLGAVAVNGTIYAIGGITYIPERKVGHTSTTTNANEAYDPATNTWIEKTPMPSPHWLDSYGIAVVQNRIYCIGGPANNVYDPATDTWEAKSPMPTSRQLLTANVVDDRIYLIGGLALVPHWAGPGYIAYSSSNLTEVYDPLTDSWAEKSPIPNAVDSYASAVIGDKIYVISGRIGGNITGLVQVYDTLTDVWTLVTPIPNPVEFAAAGVVTVGGTECIYVVGGRTSREEYNGSDLNQIYFPQNDSWTVGTPLMANRFGLSVTVANGKLYAIGGMGNCEYTATIFQYTPLSPIGATSPSQSFQPSSSSNDTQNNNLILSPELCILAILVLGTALAAAVIGWKRRRRQLKVLA